MGHEKALAAAEHTYNILIQPEPEGGYTVTCPSLPGLVTYGETLEEARTMAVEAIEAYLESLQLDDEPIPESDVVEPRPWSSECASDSGTDEGSPSAATGARGHCCSRTRRFLRAPCQGSHHVPRHPARPQARVVVPVHRRDLPAGTLRGIVRQAGLTVDEFLGLL